VVKNELGQMRIKDEELLKEVVDVVGGVAAVVDLLAIREPRTNGLFTSVSGEDLALANVTNMIERQEVELLRPGIGVGNKPVLGDSAVRLSEERIQEARGSRATTMG